MLRLSVPSPVRAPLFALFLLLALGLGGCGAFAVKPQPGFAPESRYGASPQRVKVLVQGGKAILTDMDDNAIQRPWKVVATYRQLPSMFTSFAGAARQVGCDAFWIAADITNQYSYSASGSVQGVDFKAGEQLCIRFLDAVADAERASEGSWQWTAYQRPAMNAGWSLNGNFHVGGVGKPTDQDMSLEKWFRAVPLGLGARVMGQKDKHDRTWASVGGQMMVPAIALWKVQLAGVVSLHKAFTDEAIAGDSAKETLRLGYGVLADMVVARWMMIGAGYEQWRSLDTANGPDGGVVLFRYGFPF